MNALFVGALVTGSGVALGAFGAHGLEGQVDPALIPTWKTGVDYQLVHGLALLLSANMAIDASARRRIAWAFLIGTAIFSGSLYALVLTGVRLWGAVTPVGGLAFLSGWAMLALSSRRPN